MTLWPCGPGDDYIVALGSRIKRNNLQKVTMFLRIGVFQVASRMEDNVYVTIDGTKHARLIYYYMLLEQCEEKDPALKVQYFLCILI